VRKESKGHYTLLIASAQDRATVSHKHTPEGGVEIQLDIEYGDFNKPLAKAAAALKKAKEYVANEHQANMINGYIKR
jgi:dipeptidyl-peptidase III